MSLLALAVAASLSTAVVDAAASPATLDPATILAPAPTGPWAGPWVTSGTGAPAEASGPRVGEEGPAGEPAVGPAVRTEEGFERAAIGPFTALDSELGTWRVTQGAAAINGDHVRTGAHSLHLTGGKRCEIELDFEDLGGAGRLGFWAERWTRAAPFECTVAARVGGQWSALVDASEDVVIGGFLTEVTAVLPPGADGLRIRCASPPGKGVLIDDVVLEPARPMAVVGCRALQPVLPVLVGNELNPILAVEVQTRGFLEPLELESISFDLAGTSDAEQLERVEVFHGGASLELSYDQPDQVLGEGDRFGRAQRPGKDPARLRTVRGAQVLAPGRNVFWISVTPSPGADLDGRVDARVRAVVVSGEEVPVEDPSPAATQRLGVALRSAGSGGSRAYRIPGLVTTPEGTLIAVYDIRWNGWGDLPGRIDVGCSRSVDGGRSWSPMEVIMTQEAGPAGDAGDGNRWRGDGVGDPAVLVDRERGHVHVLAAWSHGDRAWRGSGPGLAPEETGQLMLATSTDDGRSFGPLRNLTAMVKDPAWAYLLQGPGRGITMGDGRLVFPAQFQLGPGEGRTPHSTVLVSADGGATWSIGAGARPDTTESAVVELADGELMLNMRDDRGGSRAVLTTVDGGATWVTHSSSRSALIEPVCMASLIHVGRELRGVADGRLLFSNPAVASAPRRRMSIRASDDGGKSWPEDRWLLLDEGKSAGYSCLTMIDEETVGILYEGSRAHMTFQRVPLSELFPAASDDSPRGGR